MSEMPKRIWAWEYHPDNQRNGAMGAWDTRTDERHADDIPYVRGDIADELLAACKAVKFYDDATDDDGVQMILNYNDAIEAVHAAILKAEGQP